MASNGLQPGQEDAPAFPEDDASALGADLEEVARYAKKRGNLLKGATSARNAWVTDGYAVEGHYWHDTTLDELFLYTGSSWVSVGGQPTAGTVSPAGGVTWDVTLVRVGRRVYLDGKAYKAAGTFAADELAGTIPAGFRPVNVETFLSTPMLTTGFAWSVGAAYLLSDGTLQVNKTNGSNVRYIGFNGTWLVP